MNADYFRAMYDYGFWARDRLFLAMDGLSDEEYARANGFNYPSIRAVLTHCLGAEAGWFASLRQEPRGEPITEDSLPSVEALTTRWLEEEAKIREYLAGLSDSDVMADYTVRRRGADPMPMPTWQVLAHVANHGTQHRSEAAEMLTAIGRSPGELDLIFYFMQQQAP